MRNPPSHFSRLRLRARLLLLSSLLVSAGALSVLAAAKHSSATPQSASAAQQPPSRPGAAPPIAAPSAQAQPAGLNVVILDPAHGGTDPGARGAIGIRESDIVLEFATQVRSALESQGFQVIQTRRGNENPSFDDRSAIANAQRGAIFVSLHIGSTGLPGTARVYVMTDLPAANDTTGLISWDRAQAPFLPLSRKLGDLVQSFLAPRFKGSPDTAISAAVRQLRTTAAPAIAVELSSVSVADRIELDRMAPGVADAIARGASAFRPIYVLPSGAGGQP